MWFQNRVRDEFNVSVGDYKLADITTRGGTYKYADNWTYLNSKNETVFAYTVSVRTPGSLVANATELHVSKLLLMSPNQVTFRAYVGHELVHVYHFSAGIPFNNAYSERVAYEYTYKTFMSGNNYSNAFSTMRTALGTSINGVSCWGEYPAKYAIPLITKIRF